MRIKSVHIDGFGKWVDQDFSLAANPQVIYGENEAGKTTLAVFIRSILFGFANAKGKNRFQQYRPRTTAAYGGSLLVEADGQQYRITRTAGRDGGRVTVTDQRGQQFGQEKLAALLGNVDLELYQAIFGIRQADLARIGDLSREDVQRQLQQVGAVDSGEWRQLVAELLKKGDEVFKPRGRKPTLNQHLTEYQDLQQRIQQARGKYDDYQRLLKTRGAAQEQMKTGQAELKKDQARQNDLERLARLWPVFQQWQRGQDGSRAELISDEQVASADRLGIQEQELRRQIKSQEAELAQLNGRLSQFDQAQLNDYHDHLAEYQEMRGQLLQLAARDAQQRQQGRFQEHRAQEKKQLQERYGQVPPQPLSERELTQLEQLRKAPAQLANQGVILALLAFGGLLCLFGLASQHGGLRNLGLLLVIAAGGWGYYGYRQEKQQLARRDAALASFGRAHGLSSFSPDQWLTMQADLHRYAELSNQLADSALGAGQSHEQLLTIKRRLAGKVSGEHAGELARNLLAWENRRADQWRSWQAIRQQLERAQRQLTALKSQLREVQNDKWAIYQSAGVNSDVDFDRFLQQRTRAHQQQVTTAVYDQQLTDEDKAALARFTDEAALKRERERLSDRVAREQATLEAAHRQEQAAEVEIRGLATDGTLPELEQRAANLAARIWQEARRWTTYQLTAQWINQALILASADRYPAIIKAAEEFFATLTNQRYTKILLNEEGVAVLTAGQERFAVEELSTGTAEQLYVALRLGFISVMNDQVSLPIIIDDGFVNFDYLRKERVLAILTRLARHNQVLYFTADHRARQLTGVIDLERLDSE